MNANKRNVILLAALLVVVLAGGVAGYHALSAARAGAASGEASAVRASGTANSDEAASQDETQRLSAYDATVYTELGEPVLLSSLADGKPLVINFWATWCPYCVNEMDDYQQLYHLYGDRVSFAFVDCGYSSGETVQKAMDYLQENDYTDLPAYFDTDAEAISSFGAWSLPTTVIVSADGEILANTPGQIDMGSMDTALSSLVE